MAGACIFRNAVAARNRHSTQAYREFTQHRNLNRFASQVCERQRCFVTGAGACKCGANAFKLLSGTLGVLIDLRQLLDTRARDRHRWLWVFGLVA